MKLNKMHMHKSIIVENIISSVAFIFIFLFVFLFEQIKDIKIILNSVSSYLSLNIVLITIMLFFLMLLIVALFSYLMWRKTFIYIDDNFNLESGRIFKTHIKIKLNDIASIGTKKNLLQRILHTSQIKIELNAGGNDTINKKIVLSDENVKMIEDIIFNKEIKKEIIENNSLVSYTSEDIFRHLILDANFTSLIIGLIVLIPTLYYLTNESTLIVVLVLIIMGISFVWDFVKRYFDYHNFKLWGEEDKIKLSYGFFVNYKYEIPKEKISAIIISQSLQARLCHKYLLKIVNAGIGNEEGEKTILCLYSTKKEINKILKELLPDFILNDKKIKQPREALITYLINKVPLLFIVAIICMFLPKWLLVIDLFLIIWSFIQYKTKYLQIGETLVTSSSGFFQKESITIKYSKVTLMEIKDTLIGKLYNLKFIKLYMIGSLSSAVTVAGYFDTKTEKKILNNYH